jgi:hypothetical protein
MRNATLDSDVGGWLWLLIDVIMVAALAAALIYATTSWRKRSRATAVLSKHATEKLYERAADDEGAREEGRPRRRS